jgi:hypothetical protein
LTAARQRVTNALTRLRKAFCFSTLKVIQAAIISE